MKVTKHEQEGSTEKDSFSSLFLEEKENPDKINEMKEIRVNKKKRINNKFYFHFKETYYKNRYVYRTGNQENLKLKIFLDKKIKILYNLKNLM
jgi:hypothetical protein